MSRVMRFEYRQALPTNHRIQRPPISSICLFVSCELIALGPAFPTFMLGRPWSCGVFTHREQEPISQMWTTKMKYHTHSVWGAWSFIWGGRRVVDCVYIRTRSIYRGVFAALVFPRQELCTTIVNPFDFCIKKSYP